MQVLESKNQEAAKQLAEVVKEGEKLLTLIQDALHDIAQAQLEMRSWENSKTATLSSKQLALL